MIYETNTELRPGSFKTWLVMGKEENWEVALMQPLPLWGLKERYFGEFSKLSIGDYLLLYVVAPVKGVVGVGMVKDKYVDRQSLVWQEEEGTGKVIWPLRFRIEVLHLLTYNLWHEKNSELGPVTISDLNLMWRIGFQELSPEYATRIFSRIQEKWGIGLGKGANLVAPLLVSKEPSAEKDENLITGQEPALKEHNRLQNVIAEAGRLQHYFTALEYPLEGRRLDVVWKREVAGVPTFSYEVELSGGVEKALTKLRVAFQLWNSRPILIVPKDIHRKVENLVEKENKYFRESVRYYDPQTFDELLVKKRDLRNFEEQYKIY